MHRSFDPEVMRKAFEPHPDLFPVDTDFETWLGNKANVMLVEGESVGLACHEYPGVYTGHYLFKVHGKEALKLARRMMEWMVEHEGAKAFTGITPVYKRAARIFNRKLGFTSFGLIETERGLHEMFCITADELGRKN